MAATEDDSEITKLQAALAALRDSAEIMDKFSHRNKNQHRRSAWWAELSILRRGVRKLLPEGEAHTNALQAPPGRQRTKKSKQSQTQERQQNHDSQFHGRARWIRQQVVPKAYLAFTQLAADNQYAGLGILLLGVLAQISAALSPFVGEEETDPDVAGAARLVREKAAQRLPEAGNVVDAFSEGELAASGDLGIAVRREDARTVARPGIQKSLDGGGDHDGGEYDGTSRGNAHSGLAGQGANVKVTAAEPAREFAKTKDKKKKKRKRQGDEFDDLFSSLV